MADMDYSDVGNPVDSVLGGLFDDEDTGSLDARPEIPPVLPLSNKAVVDAPLPNVDPQLSKILDTLKNVCDYFGVLMSSPMVNQIKTLSAKETITESHLMWYVRGVIIATSNTVMPSITDAIADMSMETKQMQNTVSQLRRTATEVDKTATSLNRRMRESADSIKVEFESVLKQVARAAEIDLQAKPVITVADSTPLSSVLPTTLEEADNPAQSSRRIDDPVLSQPPPPQTKVAETRADNTRVIAAKRALMQKAGVAPKIISAVPDDLVDKVVSNDLLIEVGKAILPLKVRAALKTLFIENISKGLEAD
ncbi:TPA_asm: P [Nymphaea alba virus 1]|uniref:P n=1 Tax=Nymphaea alba virus 1 TaxID=2793733 RepID=A0A8D9PGY1_9RHAB|nr:P [Nymphaea alba virus 1] [Nymphaea alba virus 1]DAF42340.1 TPA_asm: P [Nymphaea alba virus 1]